VAVALRLAGRALGPRDARRHRASGKLGTDSFECARPRQPAGFRPVNPTAGGNWQCIRGSAASAPPRLAASRYGEYCTLAASRAVVVSIRTNGKQSAYRQQQRAARQLACRVRHDARRLEHHRPSAARPSGQPGVPLPCHAPVPVPPCCARVTQATTG
jgi:hypothetical protein